MRPVNKHVAISLVITFELLPRASKMETRISAVAAAVISTIFTLANWVLAG